MFIINEDKMLKKKNKIKCYEVTKNSEVYALSLVNDPAIDSLFVAFSKQKEVPKHVYLESEDRHIIVGCALIPDLPIYRRDEDEEFYITFSKETIETLAHEYLKYDRNHNFTTAHEKAEEDIYVIESWIKMSENDKSKEYGLDVPIGSWILMAKVENEEVWQRVKSGELQGWSIEAIVGIEEINNLIIEQNKMAESKEVKQEAIEISDNFWDRLRSIISDALGKPEKSQEVEETVGEIVDEMEKEGGSKEEEPKVVEQAEEVPVEEEVKPEEIAEEVVAVVEEVSETPAEEAENLQAVIDELNAKIAEKDAEIEELRKQNQKLSKQPSTKPVVKMAENKQNPRDVVEALYNGTYFNK